MNLTSTVGGRRPLVISAVSAVAVFLLALTFAGEAAAAPCDGSDGVYLYEHIDYGGACERFSADSSDARTWSIGNDTVSSLRLVGRYAALLYEHIDYSGRSELFGDDAPNALTWELGNDIVSSIRVYYCAYECLGHRPSFGTYYLTSSDVGATLYGTRAHITPRLLEPYHYPHCIAFRVSAEGARLIQTGVTKCNPSVNVDGTCARDGRFEKYVETFTDTSGYVCYPQGLASYDSRNKYSVTNTSTSGATWRAYIDSVMAPDIAVSMRSARVIVAGGEYTGNKLHLFRARATYDSWQRWDRSRWWSVESARHRLDFGWGVDGGPSGTWNVEHG